MVPPLVSPGLLGPPKPSLIFPGPLTLLSRCLSSLVPLFPALAPALPPLLRFLAPAPPIPPYPDTSVHPRPRTAHPAPHLPALSPAAAPPPPDKSAAPFRRPGNRHPCRPTPEAALRGTPAPGQGGGSQNERCCSNRGYPRSCPLPVGPAPNSEGHSIPPPSFPPPPCAVPVRSAVRGIAVPLSHRTRPGLAA